ncbi:MAG TPA: IclR family transcriptional regulator [bacterium]|nr:IclR family transcriptional regulator [bacterium]
MSGGSEQPLRRQAAPRLVPALARALDILEAVRDAASPPAIPEIVARLGLPRSTVHDLVTTLAARGYLQPADGKPHHFVLGLRSWELGGAYAASLDLPREALQAARAVSDACGETVHVAVLDHTQVVYIAKVDGTYAVRMVSAVGRRLPAHCTAVGKMLLSTLSDEKLAACYRRGKRLPAMTPNSLTSLERLRRELGAIRQRGLAFDDCESNLDVRCVAAPVYDRDGTMVAAMSASVPVSRMGARCQQTLARLIREGAQALSTRLGFNAQPRPAPRTRRIANGMVHPGTGSRPDRPP